MNSLKQSVYDAEYDRTYEAVYPLMWEEIKYRVHSDTIGYIYDHIMTPGLSALDISLQERIYDNINTK